MNEVVFDIVFGSCVALICVSVARRCVSVARSSSVVSVGSTNGIEATGVPLKGRSALDLVAMCHLQ